MKGILVTINQFWPLPEVICFSTQKMKILGLCFEMQSEIGFENFGRQNQKIEFNALGSDILIAEFWVE